MSPFSTCALSQFTCCRGNVLFFFSQGKVNIQVLFFCTAASRYGTRHSIVSHLAHLHRRPKHRAKSRFHQPWLSLICPVAEKQPSSSWLSWRGRAVKRFLLEFLPRSKAQNGFISFFFFFLLLFQGSGKRKKKEGKRKSHQMNRRSGQGTTKSGGEEKNIIIKKDGDK